MRDFLIKLTGLDGQTLDHGMIIVFSLIGSLLSTRNDKDMPILVRFFNTTAGFVLASLAGFILLENNALPFWASGISYLIGSVGYHLMNVLLVIVKLMEVDPLSFAGKVINLIWTWKLPNLKQNGGQS